MNRIALVIIAIIVYIGSSAASYFLFSNVTPSDDVSTTPTEKNDYDALVFDPNKPKTQECPLNGVKYSKEQEKWYQAHRPLGVMIENHADSRPQSGLSFADVVYEAVAEGGITRFLAVFYCQDGGIIGPIRSARTYFLDWISEYGEYPLYAHVGGANTPGPANAIGQIGEYGWNQYNDLNQFSIGFPTFRRDESRLGRTVATEHTMYSTTNKLWEVGKERKLTNVDEDGNSWDEDFTPYKFKDDADEDDRGSVKVVNVQFWGDDNYNVKWVYDPEKNVFIRNHGSTAHKDRNTNQDIQVKNLVILRQVESPANDGYEGNAHRLYKNEGTGDAVIYMDGKEIEGQWEKDDRTSRTIITDSSGDEIEFNRGLIWFQIVPTTGDVESN